MEKVTIFCCLLLGQSTATTLNNSTLNALIDAYIKAKTEVRAWEEKANGEIKLLPEIDLSQDEEEEERKLKMNLRTGKKSPSPPSSALHSFFLKGRDTEASDHMNELGLVQMHALKLASEQSMCFLHIFL